MKDQMKFQKIICMATVIIAAIAFAISLGLLTNIYSIQEWAGTIKFGSTEDNLFKTMQPFNNQLVLTYIAIIVMGCLLYITNTHKRRNYYISNYIIIIVLVVFTIAMSALNIYKILQYRAEFLSIDFVKLQEAIDKAAEKYNIFAEYTDSTLWLDMNIVASGVVALVSLVLLANLIWKNRLMKGEKYLLSAHNIKETK